MALRCVLLVAALGLAKGGLPKSFRALPVEMITPSAGFRQLQQANATTLPPSSAETETLYATFSASVISTELTLAEAVTSMETAFTYPAMTETYVGSFSGSCWSQKKVPCVSASYSLSSDGETWTSSNLLPLSCAASSATCSCGSSAKLCSGPIPQMISQTAETETVAYCVPSAVKTCPTMCAVPCVSFNYDSETGSETGLATLTCGGTCSCNSKFEQTCTLGGAQTCWPKASGPCPPDCTGKLTCTSYAFPPDFTMSSTTVCQDKDPVNFGCPTICDPATADMCGGPWDPASYCAPKGMCPPPAPTCSPTQQLCYGQNASTVGTSLDVGVCMDASMPCPPPAGWSTCVDSNGMSFWSPSGCPLNCGDMTVNQTCTVTSFQSDGSLDSSSLGNQVCAPVSSPCPCGSNAILCNYTDQFGASNVYCQPQTVDGIAQQCPLSCSSSQQLCYADKYDSKGMYTGSDQSCVDLSATCPCGTGTTTCYDELGSPYCLPSVDYTSGQAQTCPVVCNATTQNTCNTPLYDTSGALVGVNTTCVANGQQCPCPKTINSKATNALPCNYANPDGSIFTDCIPSAPALFKQWCPPVCAAGQVLCPTYSIFNKAGTYLQDGTPDVACVASLDKCNGGSGPCGPATALAQACTISGQTLCYPATVQCPLVCPAGQQICYLTDFDANGMSTGERQMCLSANATCPCGKNAVMPPGGGACMSSVAAKSLSPCGPDATKDLCWVEDFSTSGASVAKNPICIVRGDPCPCGKNSKTCPDPTDATQNVCIPKSSKDGSSSCPSPCTPDKEQLGFVTCVQTNLDKSGNFVSTSISCVNGTGACEPGANQKICPSGAMVFTGAQCRDIYGVVGGNSTALGSPAGTSAESNLVMALDGGSVPSSSLASQANNVQASLINALQIPPDVQVDVSFVAVSSSRLLQGSPAPAPAPRRVQAVVTFKSTGKAKVSPSMVATKAKNMASTGSSSLNKAFGNVGTVNTKAGVSQATVTKSVTSRATAATNAKAAAAGTRAGTVAPPTTVAPAKKPTTNAGRRTRPVAAGLFSAVVLAVATKL